LEKSLDILDGFGDLKHESKEGEGGKGREGQRMAQMENVVSAQAGPEHLTTPATWNAQPCVFWAVC
jgi:hypothetical protein